MINKLLARMFLVFMGVLASIMVMIKGWGLEPVSWWWIIGVGFGVQVLISAMMLATKDD